MDDFLSLGRKICLAVLWKIIRGEAVFVKKRENGISEQNRADLIIREGRNEDYERLASFRPPSYVQICRKRQKNNETAYVALVDNELAYIMWIKNTQSLNFAYVGQSKISVPDNSLYIYDCFTLPQYRGRGVYPFMLDYCVDLHLEKECYVACHCNNKKSMKGILKADFQLCWKLYWFKHGPVSIKWKTELLANRP